MSLLGLPIPAPGLYAKNNLDDGLRHGAASTVRDREPDGIIKGARALTDGKTDGQTRPPGPPASEHVQLI